MSRNSRIALVLLLAAFLGGYWLGARSVERSTIETTRIDTIFYERPAVVRELPRKLFSVRVPRVVFAPSDTVMQRVALEPIHTPRTQTVAPRPHPARPTDDPRTQTAAAGPHPARPQTCTTRIDDDSVTLQVAVEQRQYGDSTYRAQVSGPVVGELRPTLDWIETYARTHTITQTTTRRSRFAVTAGVGAAYTPAGVQPYVGVGIGVILWKW